jgi:hypothetical protein
MGSAMRQDSSASTSLMDSVASPVSISSNNSP